MATIALYAGRTNQMPELITNVKKSVTDFKLELSHLKDKSLSVNRSICNLDDVINTISASTQTQDDKIDTLDNFRSESEYFVEEVQKVDADVADVINSQKDDFYDTYSYLKPDYEKGALEKAWDDCKSGLASAADWCKEHWKEILITIAIVIGAVIAIAVVIFTGGAALAPLLAGLLTTIGVASGTAATIATVASFVFAGLAITSTLASSTLNLIDLWGDMSGNETFQAWKTAMNWASTALNLFYSAGIVYNSIYGITCTQTGEIFKNGIAIGEKMANRVIPYAASNELGYYNGLSGFNIINKISPNLAKYLGTIQNRNFINWMIAHGINVYDIGPLGPQIASVFYQMEQDLLSNYANLFKIILP